MNTQTTKEQELTEKIIAHSLEEYKAYRWERFTNIISDEPKSGEHLKPAFEKEINEEIPRIEKMFRERFHFYPDDSELELYWHPFYNTWYYTATFEPCNKR